MRPVPAIWNMTSAAQKKNLIVGWLNTWPAEKIDGDATIFCLLAYATLACREIYEHCARIAHCSQVVGQYVMGWVDEYELGRLNNPAEAYQWFRQAAAAGLHQAQNGLGRMLMRGQGVHHNPARGANCVRRAAERGYSATQFNLG